MPNFDNGQGPMGEIIQHGLKHLSLADLEVITIHVRSNLVVVKDVSAQ